MVTKMSFDDGILHFMALKSFGVLEQGALPEWRLLCKLARRSVEYPLVCNERNNFPLIFHPFQLYEYECMEGMCRYDCLGGHHYRSRPFIHLYEFK